MEKNNMTAVEWLVERIESTSHDLHHLMKIRSEFEQAKQMEKEQIIMAHCHNRCLNDKTYECSIKAFENAEQYYNETYGKD